MPNPKNDSNSYTHIPVLLQQAITLLNPQPGQRFVDGTLGGGGYTAELLKAGAKVLAIDLDKDALENAKAKFAAEIKSKQLTLAHGNFAQLDKIIEHHKDFYGFNAINGIVADIGLSSYQLDQSNRGITFQKKEPLDMRFDLSSQEPDARFMLNEYSEAELTKIFVDYGEERESKRIARAIVHERAEKPLHYTTDLTEIIQKALPKPVQHKWTDSARRIFQALRIAVNHELENLENFLPKALDIVSPGGVVVIVSFHSLEDRMVKQFFQESAKGCICPKEFPICLCNQTPQAEILTRKLVSATEQELKDNSRSGSAKLRAIRKASI
ncbi:MAG TPA: 16S rRNA (cytosine(1402)-N(4))-methyltransferase RsmH [Patescibacteria group bacterium]|jgi:16S rRNA (cytosine1402-N4)-methyltransferase|nr:16S rRNA (cytosine(1402)-N(4))-methyltransferase RsmH [Patescibacteria group bacterium]